MLDWVPHNHVLLLCMLVCPSPLDLGYFWMGGDVPPLLFPFHLVFSPLPQSTLSKHNVTLYKVSLVLKTLLGTVGLVWNIFTE
jgi:hypothetical protein